MKYFNKKLPMPQCVQNAVSGAVIGFKICSYENLPDKNCRVFVCINNIPQKTTREFIVNGDKKYIKKGKNTKKITHFKIK